MIAENLTSASFQDVVIVDDDAIYRELLALLLRKQGLAVEALADLQTLRERIQQRPPRVILLDVYLGKEEGLSIVPYLAANAPHTKIVVMTAFGSIDLAVEAMKCGATTFVVKTDDSQDLAKKVATLSRPSDQLSDEDAAFEDSGVVARSARMREVKRLVNSLKDIPSTVLLTGESGTGKEMIARSLHALSQRRDMPFRAVNCGAIPENLLESELFGHKRGAFTDAKDNRCGLFEFCTDGTLLLDEIGEMPLHLQVKLLRVLQEREITPLGSTRTIKINTRIIAATNRDLHEAVRLGQFREDLFYRLNVIHIDIPPLRERRDDIPTLAATFVGQFSSHYAKPIAKLSESLLTRLQAYHWPGNVRELRNAMERGVVLSRTDQLDYDDLFASSTRSRASDDMETHLEELFGAQIPQLTEARQSFERVYLKKVLHLSKGNIATASRLAGRYRADIYRLMTKYGLTRYGSLS